MEASKIILPIHKMPVASGIQTPDQFYTIRQHPAPLAGMSHPGRNSFPANFPESLAQLGFAHIICLTEANPTYPIAPLNRLGSVHLEDLYGGGNPRNEQANRENILEMARLAVDRLRAGEGVVVHCLGGVGRTGTVLGAILIQLAYDPYQVVNELKQFNAQRGKHWPESEWQSDLLLSLTS